MRAAAALLAAVLVMSPAAAQSPALSTAASAAEAEIRTAFARWTDDFNAGRAERVCDLFARDLVARYRGTPERGYAKQCELLASALSDRTRRYRNALDIREILVFGDIAIARVIWTQTVRETDSGKETTTVEPGLDVFRREPGGQWRIIRYLAFDE
jgi:steroid delta-isomerase